MIGLLRRNRHENMLTLGGFCAWMVPFEWNYPTDPVYIHEEARRLMNTE